MRKHTIKLSTCNYSLPNANSFYELIWTFKRVHSCCKIFYSKVLLTTEYVSHFLKAMRQFLQNILQETNFILTQKGKTLCKEREVFTFALFFLVDRHLIICYCTFSALCTGNCLIKVKIGNSKSAVFKKKTTTTEHYKPEKLK